PPRGAAGRDGKNYPGADPANARQGSFHVQNAGEPGETRTPNQLIKSSGLGMDTLDAVTSVETETNVYTVVADERPATSRLLHRQARHGAGRFLPGPAPQP